MERIGRVLDRVKQKVNGTDSLSDRGSIPLNLHDLPPQFHRIVRFRDSDGSYYYPGLGIRTLPGEDLTIALARQRSERIHRPFGDAQIPERFKDWEFSTFPVTEGKEEAFGLARTYAREAKSESLLIIGECGVGKTGLAVCILKERIVQEVASLFSAVPDLLDKIRSTFSGHHDYTDVMEAVKTIDFLLLDDLGAEYPTEWVKEKLYQLIGYRHDWNLPIVATSNLSLAELEEHLGARSLWRMIEMGQVIELGGRNLRDDRDAASRTR